ncbi:hypothetical protein XI06_12640, partial [Bradyrhizobium sp. CCBAU 11434]|nr:hypothetical protein [Bradyrhizobium sp. CCBAU 11434]
MILSSPISMRCQDVDCRQYGRFWAVQRRSDVSSPLQSGLAAVGRAGQFLAPERTFLTQAVMSQKHTTGHAAIKYRLFVSAQPEPLLRDLDIYAKKPPAWDGGL